jgi:hypothetical protein
METYRHCVLQEHQRRHAVRPSHVGLTNTEAQRKRGHDLSKRRVHQPMLLLRHQRLPANRPSPAPHLKAANDPEQQKRQAECQHGHQWDLVISL